MRSQPSTINTGTRHSRGSGFNSLDPSNMGLGMPAWMEPPTEERSSDGVAPVPGRTTESGLEPETRSVVEGMKVVCICKGIKKRVFWNALDAGMCTHEDINRHTGSGSGSCQGRRCGPRILDMLKRLC